MSATDEAIRVLCVDDDPDFVDFTATVLGREREAFSIRTETAAREALAALAGEPVDCVVSDYQMPGMDGLELLEAVREDHPELPFILFTGKGSEEIASEAISAGVTDYLQKGSGTDTFVVLANRIANAVDQYRAERDLREARRRFSKLVEHATDVIAILDEEGTFRYLAPSVEGILGYGPDELVGERAFEYVHPDDRERATRRFAEVVEHPDRQPTVEFRIRHADGSWVPMEGMGRNLLEDPDVEGVVAYARDITDRKALEREREAILDRISDVFFAVDAEWRITFLNRRARRIAEDALGRSAADLLGESLWDVVPERVDTELYERFHGAMADQEAASFEAHSVVLDQPVHVRAYPSESGLSVYFIER